MKKDYFGQQLEIGDLVLGAKPGGRYRNTEFSTCVIIGETNKMVRCHQVYKPQDRADTLRSLEYRCRRGGKALPEEFILLKKGYLTKQEIDNAMKIEKPVDDFIIQSDIKLP